MSVGKKIIDYGLILLIFAAPLIRSKNLTFDTVFFQKELFIQCMAALLFVVFLLRLNNEDKAPWIATPLDVPIMVFVAINAVATIFAPVVKRRVKLTPCRRQN